MKDIASACVELRQQGRTYSDIAQTLGICRMTAHYWVRRNGVRTTIDRRASFWERVDIRGPSECWPWRGSKHGPKFGYGRYTVDGRKVYTHRHAYELAHGSIAEGMVVRHSCDNPPCCNPAHLLIGTQADNAADAVKRDRFRPVRGCRNHFSKFSDETIAYVHALRAEGLTYREISERIGVSASYASRLINGKRSDALRGWPDEEAHRLAEDFRSAA